MLIIILPVEKNVLQQDDNINRGEKRKSSPKLSNDEKKTKVRPSLPSNFYSLLAQIHNINNIDETT